MGYIAPVPHYQYQQYHERGLKTEKAPYTFLPVQPVRLKTKSQDEYDDFQNINSQQTSLESSDLHHQEYIQQEVPTKLIATLTGKGNYINEYV
jgi:hypothetical protein